MPDAPKPPAVSTPWHPPTWPQVLAWLIAAASQTLAWLPLLPTQVDHAYPWLRPAIAFVGGAILFFTRSPGAPSAEQLGRTVQTLVDQRASVVPTTPAAEAKRQHVETLRGDGTQPTVRIPTTAPRERPRTQDEIEMQDGEKPAEGDGA